MTGKLCLLFLFLITACAVYLCEGRSLSGECKQTWKKQCQDQCKSEHFLCLHVVHNPSQPYCACHELIY